MGRAAFAIHGETQMRFEILLGIALMVARTMIHPLRTGLSLRVLRSLQAGIGCEPVPWNLRN